ncbi:hypothetical protein V5O48_017469, partial [Marasmius crinis-equi]
FNAPSHPAFTAPIYTDDSDISSGAESDGEGFDPYEIDFIRSIRPFGASKSATWSRAQRELYKSNPKQFSAADYSSRLESFKAKIKEICECGKAYAMKEPYNTWYFKKHVKDCSTPSSDANNPKRKRKQQPGAGMYQLDTFFASSSKPSVSITPAPQPVEVPCSGLTPAYNPLIEMYIDRTGAEGGGARSVNAISKQIYGVRFKRLSPGRKQRVKHVQRTSQAWKIDRQLYAVFSSNCSQIVLVNPSSSTPEAPRICASCLAIGRRKVFKKAVAIPRPLDKNYKYLNKEYRNQSVSSICARTKGLEKLMGFEDATTTACAVYVTDVLGEKHSGNKADQFFGSLLQVMLVKRAKDEKGVGMQNFCYASDLVQLAHLIQMHSTVAYNFLREFLPLPTVRNLRQHRAKEPSFPLDIEEATFTRAASYLDKMSYDGPVAVSCDDTKLLAALRPYHDKANNQYYLVGAVGKPKLLGNPDEFREIIDKGLTEKATKLRLWCFEIPLPGVPTTVLAAKAIPGSLTATTLSDYSWEILSGLIACGILVRSYATDGASTERSSQRILRGKATTKKVICIPHPGRPEDESVSLDITIHFFGKDPIAFIQDPKHALKTVRNNLFSGSKVLTFPNDIALYSQVWEMYLRGGPIFKRDWYRPDKMDDSASTRLSSGNTLKWLVENTKWIGLIVYMFVFGELVDGYESCRLDIQTRVGMVLRAYYFLETWIHFLQSVKYPIRKHCISYEAIDIVNTLVHGFLEAAVIYRDHVPGRRPLLPWRMGSAPCERVFGKCRRLIKDFMMVQFYEMVPKLFIGLREEALASRFSDGKETVGGYTHTDPDCRGADLSMLAIMPSDNELKEQAELAWQELESLWAVLGATASDILAEQHVASASIPPILTWFSAPDTVNNSGNNEEDSDAEEEEGEEEEEGGSDGSNHKFSSIQDALDAFDLDMQLKPTEEQKAMSLRYAAIAHSINEHMKIQALPELDDDRLADALSDDGNYIAKLLAESLPPVKVDPASNSSKPSKFNPFHAQTSFAPAFASADLTELVKLRFEHQTQQAASGGRGVKSKPTSSKLEEENSELGAKKSKELSPRQKIMREFNEIYRDQELVGIGTGVERKLCWMAKADVGEAETPAGGNTANAATVATAAAARKLATRIDAWAKRKRLPTKLGTAGLTPEWPLAVSTEERPEYGFVYDGEKIVLCCAALAFAKLQAKKFALLPSHSFLCILEHTPTPTDRNRGMSISDTDWATFCALKVGMSDVKDMLKPPKKGKGTKTAVEELSDNSGKE